MALFQIITPYNFYFVNVASAAEVKTRYKENLQAQHPRSEVTWQQFSRGDGGWYILDKKGDAKAGVRIIGGSAAIKAHEEHRARRAMAAGLRHREARAARVVHRYAASGLQRREALSAERPSRRA